MESSNMAETLAVRVTRILAGSAHAFLDAVEDMAPEAMIRQAIREIDQVMGEVRVDLGKVEAAKHLITSQINKLNNESEQLAAHIETALKSDQDDLARAAQAGVSANASGKANQDARVEDARSAFDRVLARQTGVAGLNPANAG